MNFWIIWLIIIAVGFINVPTGFLFAGGYIGWKLASLLVD